MPKGIYKHRKGIKPSEETRKKMSLAKKGHKGYWLGKKRPNISGENASNWQGGNSKGYKTGYYSADYIRWRTAVFERDSYTCQICRKIGTYLTAHHIKSFAKYPELRFDIDNGITLCEDCHKLTDNYKGKNKRKIKI